MDEMKKELREEFFAELEKLKMQVNHCKTFEPKIDENKDNINKILLKVCNYS